ncbi:MAG: hypothetical protein J5871_06470, partial [Bacteroidales bacterium]|nr:hypothetical protein [Bacteroidales bacterium]
ADARCIAVAPATPRAEKAEALAAWLAPRSCVAAPSVAAGLRMAMEAASAVPDSLVYVGGSAYVVSEALTYLAS